MRLLEQSEEHSSQLQVEPLSGRAYEYLDALAAAMTEQGAVDIGGGQRPRTIAHSVAVKLRDAGQIAALPEPQAVLNALCAHHVLERLTYPVSGFRFEHQQFQDSTRRSSSRVTSGRSLAKRIRKGFVNLQSAM